MLSRGRKLAPRVHLPLRNLALCLDCDECFEMGPERCPACGSATWTALSRFWTGAASARRSRRTAESVSPANDGDDSTEGVRQLIVVAHNRENLYEHLKRAFAGNDTVRVVLNRRVAERRQRRGPCAAERRGDDRRAPLTTDGLLRAIGWAVVRETPPRRRVR